MATDTPIKTDDDAPILLGTSSSGRRRKVIDVAMASLVTLAFLIALVPLISLILEVLIKGGSMLSWQFLTTDMMGVFGDSTDGGIVHALWELWRSPHSPP